MSSGKGGYSGKGATPKVKGSTSSGVRITSGCQARILASSQTNSKSTSSKSTKSGITKGNSNSGADDLLASLARLSIADRTKTPDKKSVTTPWMTIDKVKQKSPPTAGVYEIKHKYADEVQYIGHSKDLNARIKQHQSGYQEIDEFIKDHKESMLYRFKETPSKETARELEAKKITSFEKTTGRMPEYNYRH